MSGGADSNPLKNPLYWMVKQDSRGASQLGRTFHWDYLKNEGKTNQENPGRALTKAGEYAATWYLGSLLGGAGDAGLLGDAAEATPEATDAAITASQVGSASEGASLYAPGALNGMAGGNAGLTQAALQGPEGSMESALPDTGYTPSSLRYAFQNANSANGTPLSQNLSNYARNGMTNLQNGSTMNRLMAGGKTSAGKQLMMQQGMKLLNPQQPQAMPRGAPAPQGQQGPLTSPYGPGGNSLGVTNMSEREKQYLRSLGYQV